MVWWWQQRSRGKRGGRLEAAFALFFALFCSFFPLFLRAGVLALVALVAGGAAGRWRGGCVMGLITLV